MTNQVQYTEAQALNLAAMQHDADYALASAGELQKAAAGQLVADLDALKAAGHAERDVYVAVRDAFKAAAKARGMGAAAVDTAWSRLCKAADVSIPKATGSDAQRKQAERAAPTPEQIAEAHATFEALRSAPHTADNLRKAKQATDVLVKAAKLQEREAKAQAKASESAATKAARQRLTEATKEHGAFLIWCLDNMPALEVAMRGEARIVPSRKTKAA